jgi:L-amino acid N-acyltransferase YncA
VQIRLARRADLSEIVAIYNAAIPGHTATADLAPLAVAEREAWFEAHQQPRRPLWVADEADQVIGWVSLSTFYARPAYDPTVEISIYVAPEHQRRGVGRALIQHSLASAPGLGIKTILAVLFAHNNASRGLLETFGFAEWGYLPRVTHMPEGRRDVLILGLELDPASEGV